jgi:nucleoside-diphosphate-sugar epimerase
MRILIVGCGYVGVPLGAELAAQGHEVFGMRRSAQNQAELQAAGIHPLAADVTSPESLAQLPGPFDWVVNCVSASRGGPEEYGRVYREGTRNLIAWLSPTPLAKFVYTSSTSVYGQTDGSLVKETSPATPNTGTGRILLETETLLLEAFQKKRFPAVILRLAGIYGPDRGYWFKQFLQGEARMEGAGERFLNMIHRDDVARSIIAALKHGRPGEIYNAAVTQLHLFRWLAEELNRPLPPSLPAEPDPARRRGLTNKRVCNRKLKMELGSQFKYATFREGYSAEIQRLEEAGQAV